MRHLHSSSFRRTMKCLVATCRERSAVRDQHPAPRPLDVYELAAYGNTPLLVRLAEQLAAALLAIDEALAMCDLEDEACRDAAWIKPEIRSTYDHVNDVLKRISN